MVPHGSEASEVDIDGGKMDGFVKGAEMREKCVKSEPFCSPCDSESKNKERCDDVMGYHDAREIPNYWKYAEKYVLQDNLFESVASWSLPSHLWMVSGWSAICPHKDPNPMDCENSINPESPSHTYYGKILPGKTTYSWTDITYLLDKHGVSWGYYLLEGGEPDCELNEEVSCATHKQTRTRRASGTRCRTSPRSRKTTRRATSSRSRTSTRASRRNRNAGSRTSPG